MASKKELIGPPGGVIITRGLTVGNLNKAPGNPIKN